MRGPLSQTPVGVEPFRNHLPVRISFGDGAASELGSVLDTEGARRVLLMVEDGFEENSPAGADAIERLESGSPSVTRFLKPVGEPTTVVVDQAAEKIAAAQVDAVVALGGGSVIDTAKAARLVGGNEAGFSGWLASERLFPVQNVKLIAVPTTAGTGSEVSGGAVITDGATGRKSGIANPSLRPDYAVVDPVLTHSVPPQTTVYTGIDALAQAIAGMIARTRTPVGDALALEAVGYAGRSLITAYQEGDNPRARSEMACASLLAGITMNVSDCGAEHSLGQAIASRFPAPHGLTVGLVLVETLERECQHVPEALERVADALGIDEDGSLDGSRALRGISDLLRKLDFPVLGSLGVREGDIDELVDLSLDDYFIGLSPAPWSRGEVRGAFSSALALKARA